MLAVMTLSTVFVLAYIQELLLVVMMELAQNACAHGRACSLFEFD